MRTKAFTLIELLCVIAIVAVLAAVLFPVFAQAKEAAKKTSCLSHSTQLSLGVQLYANDTDDGLPPTQNGDNVLWPDLVNPYVRNDRVRACPDDSRASNSYGLNELIFVDFTDYLPATPPSVPTMGSLERPSDTVMLGEVGTEDDFVTPRENAYKLTAPDGVLNDLYDARSAARHFASCNLGFFDGHCRSLKLDRFYTGQTPRDRWFCQNPGDPLSCRSPL